MRQTALLATYNQPIDVLVGLGEPMFPDNRVE